MKQYPHIRVTNTVGQELIIPPAPTMLESLRQVFGGTVHVAYKVGRWDGEIRMAGQVVGRLERLEPVNAPA